MKSALQTLNNANVELSGVVMVEYSCAVALSRVAMVEYSCVVGAKVS